MINAFTKAKASWGQKWPQTTTGSAANPLPFAAIFAGSAANSPAFAAIGAASASHNPLKTNNVFYLLQNWLSEGNIMQLKQALRAVCSELRDVCLKYEAH